MRSARKERLLRLLAGRRGLKVIRNRRLTTSGQSRYCLRALWDASLVLGHLPGGCIGLVKALERRETVAVWLSLKEVQKILTGWSEPTPVGRGNVRRPVKRNPTTSELGRRMASTRSSFLPNEFILAEAQ